MEKERVEKYRTLFLGSDPTNLQTVVISGITSFVVLGILFSQSIQRMGLSQQEAFDMPIIVYIAFVVLIASLVGLLVVSTGGTRPVTTGLAVGFLSVLVVFSTLIILIEIVELGADGLVLFGVFTLIGTSILAAHSNNGLAICWYVVAMPTAGFLSPIIIGGTPMGDGGSVLGGLLEGIALGVLVGIVVGTIGFALEKLLTNIVIRWDRGG